MPHFGLQAANANVITDTQNIHNLSNGQTSPKSLDHTHLYKHYKQKQTLCIKNEKEHGMRGFKVERPFTTLLAAPITQGLWVRPQTSSNLNSIWIYKTLSSNLWGTSLRGQFPQGVLTSRWTPAGVNCLVYESE